MKLPGKAIATILVVVALAGAALFAQRSSSGPASISLSSNDMQLLLSRLPDQSHELASNPDKKPKFVEDLKKMLALGAVAEAAGYGERSDLDSQIRFRSDYFLANQYRQQHPEVKVSDEEINKFNQANPQAFDDFLKNNREFQQQAAGPQREQLKRAYAELMVFAARAKADGASKDRATQLQLLLIKYDALSSAYQNDLRNDDKLITEGDIDAYYKAHPEDFTEVRARHILIATNPGPRESDDEDKTDEKKSLSKDEARKKAEAILDRIHKGEDFATLARDNSDDTQTKAGGGDLNYFGHGKMVPEFEQAAFSLKPGQVSGLVETKYGLHIIKVEDVRQLDPSDARVRQRVTDKVRDDAINKRIDQIARDSKVSVAENFEVPEAAVGNPHQGQVPAGHP